MRWKTLVALIALSAVALSGCVGGGDGGDETHADDCDEFEGEAHGECHAGEDTQGNVTVEDENETVIPNVAPVAALTMTADDGTVLDNGTAIMAGQNITFSAASSTDSDGEVVLVGLTVTDSNSTRNAQLMADGEFVDVTMPFPHAGIVNVTLRVLDDDGDGAIIETFTAINGMRTVGAEITAAEPSGELVHADSCQGPGAESEASLIDQYSHAATFTVDADTRWIEATVTSGDVRIAICSPDKEKLSEEGTETVSTEDHPEGLPPSVEYRVFTVANAPGEYSVDLTFHFEPKPAE